MTYKLLVTCPKNLEGLLQDELATLDATALKQTVGGVYCDASLKIIYQICLWSRIANRVLLQLFSNPVSDNQQFYKQCYAYDWAALFKEDSTLSVNFSGKSENIRNTMYGALLIKDAIVDKLRDQTGERCDIQPQGADCVIHGRLHRGILNVYYDLSGESLHKRGYRQQTGSAPLKENLAAALLYRAKWPTFAANQQPFIDPCCGSGTLLIEAAMIATDKAPSLDRHEFGFLYWQSHDATLWEEVRAQAIARHQQALDKPLPIILGYDQDTSAVIISKNNILHAGFSELIRVEPSDFKELVLEDDLKETPGLIVCNPPYGERMENVPDLIPIYQDLGVALREHFSGWQVAIITSETVLAKSIGLRSHKKYPLFNGVIPCQLYLFSLHADNKLNHHSIAEKVDMISNRIKKNNKKLQSWRSKNAIEAYRVYDSDIPEYACAIDVYNDWAYVQEYKAPSDIPVEKAEQRVLDLVQAIPHALGIPHEQIIIKQRKRQKGRQQYERQDESGHRLIVTEGEARFIVNCKDYIDSGLFLDHRLLRRHIFETANGLDILNLFCYTGSFSVQAALGGAAKTTNVDMSATYLKWAQQNFVENKINVKRHEFIQANCLEWIKECKQQFDIIILDPPSFSNSKRMEGVFDIQRDHEDLIVNTMRLLKPNGCLYFSSNLTKFKISPELSNQFKTEDIGKKTIDKDFERRPNMHHCFLITDI